MDLSTTRGAVAAALSSVSGVNVRSKPFTTNARPGDGWVTVTRLQPADFTRCMATLGVVVILASEQQRAEERLDDLAVPLIDAATGALPMADVSLEAQAFATDSGGTLYGVLLTLTTEVD